MARVDSIAGRLVRLGFQEPRDAAESVREWPEGHHGLFDLLASGADPDAALRSLHGLAQVRPGLLDELVADTGFAARLVAVLGASDGAARDLTRHPHLVDTLVEPARQRTREELAEELLQARDPDALRVAYRGAQLRIAARDLTSSDPVDAGLVGDVGRELADLADACVEAGLALARREVGEDADLVRVGVVALGKTGGQELNYVSDVDVLFVAEPALGEDGEPLVDAHRVTSIGTNITSRLVKIISSHTAAGTIWPLDAALRPEGKAGPLVRSLASHQAYYERWARNWEFQAMLKSRPMAGDLALAAEFEEMVKPHVWQAGERDDFVAEARSMRRRVVAEIPAKQRDREIKLGEGGLRDVEFTVQLLQLVHGRGDERIRSRGTLAALSELVDCGYVGRSDGDALAAAYAFLRAFEHRTQLVALRRTHLAPDSEASWRRIGRSLGLANPAETLRKRWREVRRTVQALHRQVFYSPLLEAVARLPQDALRLTPESAATRLRALGYDDPQGALRHITALTQGLSRRAEIQRQLLPAMLAWFAEGPNPDHGLLSFRQVSEGLGDSSWYLRALRDEGLMAQRLATILSSSRYLVDLLKRDAQTVQLLGDDDRLVPRSLADLGTELRAVANRHDDPAKAVQAVRSVRRRELFRIGVADVLELVDTEQVGEALTDLTRATIDATMAVALRGRESAPRLSVVALGRWGGRELSYASDADATVVFAGEGEKAAKEAAAVVTEVRRLLTAAGPEPALQIDLDLRPDGKSGPMVRSLEGYRGYYQRWSRPWEAQALVRADLGAGDDDLGRELLAIMDERRWPRGGVTPTALAEMRRLKDRMETERLPRGVDPKRHLKLGPGGLSDVEWTVQLLQLRHAHEVPQLRTPRTLPALRAAVEAELVSEADARALAAAWRTASTIRNRIMLVKGKQSESLPKDARDMAAVAVLMGYGDGESSHLLARYQRVTRRARQVVNRIFWGES